MHCARNFTNFKTTRMATPLCLAMLGAITTVNAQQPQIPTLQVCNQTLVQGTGTVTIQARKDASHTGSFSVTVNLHCDPNSGYPIGSLEITNLSMNDSLVEGAIIATTFEQLTSTGRVTPTAYLNGRCSVDSSAGAIPGCRYWIMFADNNPTPSAPGTPDVVSFLVFNKAGQRVAYGTGPLTNGHITVAPTPF